MVDPALDGPREIVEFGKDRAERPADNGVATALSRWRFLLVNGATRSSATNRKINGLEISVAAPDPSRIHYSWPT